MAISIVEKILGTTNPYVSTYIEDNIRLIRSIVVKNNYEADTFNLYVNFKYGKFVDQHNKRSWRYYKHLMGEYHEVDRPMKVISRDNREEIVLTRETMSNHLETRASLNEYGAFYDSVVKEYPDQELLLRTILSNSKIMTFDEIESAPCWKIISYNGDLIEKQETDVIPRLEENLLNFVVKNAIGNYVLVDNMFLAVLFTVVYNHMLLTLFNIRISNSKTSRVHSHYLTLYLASHHSLDKVYDHIDEHQRMWLYRNLKYLDSHAGSNKTLGKLVDNLFDHKRIMLTNYTYYQIDELDETQMVKYGYKQILLNKQPLVHDKNLYDVNALAQKESKILDNNRKEYQFNKSEIDFHMKNSLDSKAFTKDLEITLIDSTNEVKHKLSDILIEYWATTVALGYNEVSVVFVDPIEGKDLNMSSKDGFKLFMYLMIRSVGLTPMYIPDYDVWRAFKDPIPKQDYFMKKVQHKWSLVEKEVEDIRVKVPPYRFMDTRRNFRRYVESVYNLELGMWIYLGSSSELVYHADINEAFESMHTSYIVKNDEETVDSFLSRIDSKNLVGYTKEQIDELLAKLIDHVGDGILEANDINRLIQEAITTIFKCFKSYSTQTLSDFTINDPTLLNLDITRLTLNKWGFGYNIIYDTGRDFNCITNKEGVRYRIDYDWKLDFSNVERNRYRIRTDNDLLVKASIKNKASGVEGITRMCVVEELTTPDTILTPDDLKKYDLLRFN